MDRLWRRVGQGLAALAVLLALAFAFGPREPLDLAPGVDAATPGDDLDAWLAASEAAAGAVPPAMQKRIYWAGPKGARTAWAVSSWAGGGVAGVGYGEKPGGGVAGASSFVTM